MGVRECVGIARLPKALIKAKSNENLMHDWLKVFVGTEPESLNVDKLYNYEFDPELMVIHWDTSAMQTSPGGVPVSRRFPWTRLFQELRLSVCSRGVVFLHGNFRVRTSRIFLWCMFSIKSRQRCVIGLRGISENVICRRVWD